MEVSVICSGACLSAVIREMHGVKVFGAHEVTLWETGIPRRKFLYSEDTTDLSFMAKSRSAGTLLGMAL